MVKRSRTTAKADKSTAQPSKRPGGPSKSPAPADDGKVPRADTATSSSQAHSDKMQRIFGFTKSDFSSWSALVKLLNKPCDPASLGVWRFIFGMYMELLCYVHSRDSMIYISLSCHEWGFKKTIFYILKFISFS